MCRPIAQEANEGIVRDEATTFHGCGGERIIDRADRQLQWTWLDIFPLLAAQDNNSEQRIRRKELAWPPSAGNW